MTSEKFHLFGYTCYWVAHMWTARNEVSFYSSLNKGQIKAEIQHHFTKRGLRVFKKVDS